MLWIIETNFYYVLPMANFYQNKEKEADKKVSINTAFQISALATDKSKHLIRKALSSKKGIVSQLRTLQCQLYRKVCATPAVLKCL